jgi:preprotein translocase subunit SecB
MTELNKANDRVKFRFINFIVKESHFVLNTQGEYKININIDPKGYIFQTLNQFHLELNITVGEEEDNFSINTTAIGIFEFDAETDIEDYKSSYFILNAPAIMFPYVRAYISNISTQSGVFSITLPTLNLTGIAETLKNNIITL